MQNSECRMHNNENCILHSTFCISKPKEFGLWPRAAAVGGAALHQNDVIPHPPYGLPGDDVVLRMPQQAEEAAFSRNDDALHLPPGHLHLHIRHLAKPGAIPDTDDLLAA